jgi:GT2 family glycosyltransferase
MKHKIGLAIITCNRKEFFKNCINSVPQVDELIVVNDGEPYQDSIYPAKVTELIQHRNNKGVGKSKNDALKYLLEKQCEHIFLVEDDIIIKDEEVINYYINASIRSGIFHLNFAYHGHGNRDKNNNPIFRSIVKYGDTPLISLNKHILGAFSYYNKKVLLDCGFMDERFINAYEHVDHTLIIANKGYHPQFWWFADLAYSYNFIDEQDDFHSESIIRKNKFRWKMRLRYNQLLFFRKNKYLPSGMPEAEIGEVIRRLENIKNLYGDKNLFLSIAE